MEKPTAAAMVKLLSEHSRIDGERRDARPKPSPGQPEGRSEKRGAKAGRKPLVELLLASAYRNALSPQQDKAK